MDKTNIVWLMKFYFKNKTLLIMIICHFLQYIQHIYQAHKFFLISAPQITVSVHHEINIYIYL